MSQGGLNVHINISAEFGRRQAHAIALPICLMFLALTARAAGIHEISIPADSSGPQIFATLWTPCATPPGPVVVSSEAGALTIQAVKDCAVRGKSLPLILISHGMFGDRFSHHDTAEFLADAGFAVLTLNHTLDSVAAMKEKTADDISSFLVRPVDIQRAITFVSRNSAVAADIDSRRIGFFGFSRGGYTGLVLAGAVPDFRAPPFPCPEEFQMCRQIRDNDIPEHAPGYEPRIRAFVIADPISFFPNQASLKKVTAPIQLWSSEHGGMGVRPQDLAAVKQNLPHPPEFYRPANSGHLSFIFPCSADIAQAAPFICTDPPGFDRSEFHNELNARVLAFFRRHLQR
jgi:predicted dienelactone hydrolase